MPEEQSNTTRQPSPHGDTASQRSGALTGSGALEFIAHVTENPTVAATMATTAGVTAKHLLDKLKQPQSQDPPHSGLWVPPSADE
jgi:hypothetical protein